MIAQPFKASLHAKFVALASITVAIASGVALADLPAPQVTLSSVYSTGYATGGINSVAINRNNLTTVGNYQFAAFYDSNSVRLGRRTVGSNTWSVLDTGLTPNSITDDHDTVSLAVDGDGYMHLSWGMHNNLMNYRVSNTPVTGVGTWNSTNVTFSKPAYWTGTAANADSSVTYPEFYNIPNSKDLLMVYRQGGTGGGSGNGDEYFVRYDTETKTFSKNRVINGQATSVNAYLNNLAYDSTGKLQMSWTWRSTPAFQTNHNIMYATSADNGVSWQKQDGANFTLPITEGQGGVIASIPEQSTLINQTSMSLDSQDRPLIATWYAPNAAQGDHTRQYMLHHYDGSAWQVSQLTNRPTEAKQTDSTVRELGRPIVLVDDEDRVYVIMRYKEVGNNIVVAVSEDRVNWETLTLAAANLGTYEPTVDWALWERDNILNLFYQPVGLGQATSQVSVLEWDTNAYFASIPEPASLCLFAPAIWLLHRRRRNA